MFVSVSNGKVLDIRGDFITNEDRESYPVKQARLQCVNPLLTGVWSAPPGDIVVPEIEHPEGLTNFASGDKLKKSSNLRWVEGLGLI